MTAPFAPRLALLLACVAAAALAQAGDLLPGAVPHPGAGAAPSAPTGRSEVAIPHGGTVVPSATAAAATHEHTSSGASEDAVEAAASPDGTPAGYAGRAAPAQPARARAIPRWQTLLPGSLK